MEWPWPVADADAVIVREETPDGLRFVVHRRRTPQVVCLTYAEAETCSLAHSERVRSHAWYATGRALHLLARTPMQAAPAGTP